MLGGIIRRLRWRASGTVIPGSLPDRVIATCVNGGYARCGLLENWACGLASLGLEDLIVIGALDEEAARIAARLPGTMLRVTGSDELGEPGVEALEYRREGWKCVVFSKLSFVRRLLQSGREVLFSDADVVFLKDPLGFFPGEGRADFAAQSDAPVGSPGEDPRSLCSGLYFAHPTREAIEALRFTPENAGRCGGDQDFLRARLGVERAARCVMLGRDDFPNGNVWRAAPPPAPVAVHFNWIEGVANKIRWMRECGFFPERPESSMRCPPKEACEPR